MEAAAKQEWRAVAGGSAASRLQGFGFGLGLVQGLGFAV